MIIMSDKSKDLTGQRFGRWVVIKRGESQGFKKRWYCNCDCGTKNKLIRQDTLLNGSSVSCGCYAREERAKRLKRYNEYDLSGDYGIGYTSNGEEFWFDLEDYDKIKDYSWHITGGRTKYVRADPTIGEHVFMHRLIMDCYDEDLIVDHIGGCYWDNRKIKLRVCSRSQNNMNSKLSKNNTSGCSGVHKKENGRWRANITVDRKVICLGTFEKYEDAVKARKDAEEKYFGEYSYDNSQILYRKGA